MSGLRPFSWVAVWPEARLEVGRPHAIRLGGKKWFLFLFGDGELGFFEDRCPHRNFPLTQDGASSRDRITCGYHGWEFDSSGRCARIPGLVSNCKPVPLLRASVARYGGWVWVSPERDQSTIEFSSLPTSADPRPMHRSFLHFEIPSPMDLAIENLLDGFHTPYVHRGILRLEAKRVAMTAQARLVSPQECEIVYQGEQQGSGWISRIFERHPRTHTIARFRAPGTAILEFYNTQGVMVRFTTHFWSESETTSGAWTCVETPAGLIPHWLKEPLFFPFLKRVLKQDGRALTLQAKNIESFGGAKFVNTELDLIRPYLNHFLQGREAPPDRSIRFLL